MKQKVSDLISLINMVIRQHWSIEKNYHHKFQPDKIFVRNNLFEQVIKSCKSTNIEFTMLKEKLDICLYEENYYEEKIIKIQDEKPIEVTSKVSTKKST